MVKMQDFFCADLGQVRFNSYNCCNILNTTRTCIYSCIWITRHVKYITIKRKNLFLMYTIYDNILQKNRFSTTTSNVKVIQSSYISSKLFQVNNLQKMHDDHFVEGKTVEHQACYLSLGLLSGDHTQCQQKDYQL